MAFKDYLHKWLCWKMFYMLVICVMCNAVWLSGKSFSNTLFVCLYLRSFALALSRLSCENGRQMGKGPFLGSIFVCVCWCTITVIKQLCASFHVPTYLRSRSGTHSPHGTRLWIGQGGLCWGANGCWMSWCVYLPDIIPKHVHVMFQITGNPLHCFQQGWLSLDIQSC